jgi:hypothetical protein
MRQKNLAKIVLRKLVPDKLRFHIRVKLNKINKKEFTPPPINPDTKKKLIEHYKPMVEELSVLIKRDLSQWIHPD